MAKFELEIPKEVIWQFEDLTKNCDQMIDEMIKAGAEEVKSRIYQGMPAELKKYATARTLSTSKPYRMATKDAKAVYVWFGGYKKDLDGSVYRKKYAGNYSKENAKAYAQEAGTPLELIANMFEYGSKKRNYPKHPFLRKAFHKREIERAMLRAQKKWIKEDAEFK